MIFTWLKAAHVYIKIQVRVQHDPEVSKCFVKFERERLKVTYENHSLCFRWPQEMISLFSEFIWRRLCFASAHCSCSMQWQSESAGKNSSRNPALCFSGSLAWTVKEIVSNVRTESIEAFLDMRLKLSSEELLYWSPAGKSSCFRSNIKYINNISAKKCSQMVSDIEKLPRQILCLWSKRSRAICCSTSGLLVASRCIKLLWDSPEEAGKKR